MKSGRRQCTRRVWARVIKIQQVSCILLNRPPIPFLSQPFSGSEAIRSSSRAGTRSIISGKIPAGKLKSNVRSVHFTLGIMKLMAKQQTADIKLSRIDFGNRFFNIRHYCPLLAVYRSLSAVCRSLSVFVRVSVCVAVAFAVALAVAVRCSCLPFAVSFFAVRCLLFGVSCLCLPFAVCVCRARLTVSVSRCCCRAVTVAVRCSGCRSRYLFAVRCLLDVAVTTLWGSGKRLFSNVSQLPDNHASYELRRIRTRACRF